MAQTLYAAFDDAAMAEKAAGALLDHGVRAEDVSLVATAEGVGYKGGDVPERETRPGATAAAAKGGISTTTVGDAESGAVKGAGIGLGLGTLAALLSLMIPGVGLVTGGGALATALAAAAGTTAAGAATGGVYGYLKDQGVPDAAASDYERSLKNGGAVMAITLPSGDIDQATVSSILAKYNARGVQTYGAVA
jgi:hypothetical protein